MRLSSLKFTKVSCQNSSVINISANNNSQILTYFCPRSILEVCQIKCYLYLWTLSLIFFLQRIQLGAAEGDFTMDMSCWNFKVCALYSTSWRALWHGTRALTAHAELIQNDDFRDLLKFFASIYKPLKWVGCCMLDIYFLNI